MTWASVSMTADTGLPLTSIGTIIDKPLISSEQEVLTKISFREDVQGLEGTRVGVGLLDGNSLTTVGGTAIGGQPLEGISGIFGTMVGLEAYGLNFGQLIQSLTFNNFGNGVVG